METNFKWKIDDLVMGIRRCDLLPISGKVNYRGDHQSFSEKENVYKIGIEGKYYGWLLESEIIEFDNIKWEIIIKLYQKYRQLDKKLILKNELMKIGLLN